LGAVCVLIGGRRKAIVMPLLWGVFVGLVYLRVKGLQGAVAVALMLALLGGAFVFAGGELGVHQNYLTYAATTTLDAPERFLSGTVGAVYWTVVQSGWLGRGIGVASQGMRHLGTNVDLGWQESGPSKLAVELGIPGMVCALLLALALARACLNAMRWVPQRTLEFKLLIGLLGIAIANASSFFVSHQIYSDLTVIGLSAFFIGAALSAPRWSRAAAGGSRGLPRSTLNGRLPRVTARGPA